MYLVLWVFEVFQSKLYSNIPKKNHFTNDTNLLNFNTSIKLINKRVNHDLKNLANLLMASKVSLNVKFPLKLNWACAFYFTQETTWQWFEN